MENIDYTEFQRAANRHLITCKALLENCEADSSHHQQKKLWNIYYLSGYIFETMFKYVYFRKERNNRGITVECINDICDAIGIPADKRGKKILHHRLNALKGKVEPFLAGQNIPFIDVSVGSIDRAYFDTWSENVRYSENGQALDLDKVKRYMTNVEKFYNKMKIL